jgi:membrane dipeptidase
MRFIIDSHQDLAWNMLNYGRDYTRSVSETRELEAGSPTVEETGDTLLGWPEYQQARVIAVFATLYTPPKRTVTSSVEEISYPDSDYNTAHRLYWQQLDHYHRIADSQPEFFRLVGSRADLSGLLDHWNSPSENGHPVGLIPLMEGADGIRSPQELAAWWDFGLRTIGLAWAGTRYSGGTNEPGPLTDEGRTLLKAMADFPFTLDLSHMDEPASLEALDRYTGPIVATHANCLALLDADTRYHNRHLSDRVLRGLFERDGIVGVVPYNTFLKANWSRLHGDRREATSITDLADHIDHICQLAGDSRHVAFGTDFDGGFGLQSVPPEIDSIVDLHKLEPILLARGYHDPDIAGLFGENWLRHLTTHLP